MVDLTDDFISTRYHGDSKWLVKKGTGDTFLADKSFTTTSVNYTYNFTASSSRPWPRNIATNGDLAFGLDPDCHFFNDGVKFTMTLTRCRKWPRFTRSWACARPSPAPTILRRRRSAQLEAIEISER